MCYYVINYEQWEAPMNGRGFAFNRLCFCYTNMYNIDVGTTLTMVNFRNSNNNKCVTNTYMLDNRHC